MEMVTWKERAVLAERKEQSKAFLNGSGRGRGFLDTHRQGREMEQSLIAARGEKEPYSLGWRRGRATPITRRN